MAVHRQQSGFGTRLTAATRWRRQQQPGIPSIGTPGSGGQWCERFADDVEFASVNFRDHPGRGVPGRSQRHIHPARLPCKPAAMLGWAEPHQNFVISGTSKAATGSTTVTTQAGLSAIWKPQQGSFESGIGLIGVGSAKPARWKCRSTAATGRWPMAPPGPTRQRSAATTTTALATPSIGTGWAMAATTWGLRRRRGVRQRQLHRDHPGRGYLARSQRTVSSADFPQTGVSS